MIFKNRKNSEESEVDKKELSENKINIKHADLTFENAKILLEGSEDILFRKINLNDNVDVGVIYIDGLINLMFTSDFILKPLKQEQDILGCRTEKEVMDKIQNNSIYYVNQIVRDTLKDAIADILIGNTVIFFDDEQKVISFDNKGFDRRAISEPTRENIIKGSKDSFVETIRINTATIRRRIKSHNLKTEMIFVGERTQTPIDIIYMDTITNKKLIEEVKTQLKNINTDEILTVTHIEENIFLENKTTVFPLMMYTELPEKFCANIIEGYVGIIVDGIPLGITLPATLAQSIQAPEDYSQNFYINSAIRLMRITLMLLTLFLPGLYIAIATFHPGLIPSELQLFLESSKEGVPFPSTVEVIFMLISFEILVEAGIRLPKTIGSAVSIVGAIIVGQAAVEAKLVSPSIVVIIAITAIASFSMPNQDFSNALRAWRLILVISSSILGIFGLTTASLVLLVHLADIKTYGVPYLKPFAEGNLSMFKDTLIRAPIFSLKERPEYLKTYNQKRR